MKTKTIFFRYSVFVILFLLGMFTSYSEILTADQGSFWFNEICTDEKICNFAQDGSLYLNSKFQDIDDYNFVKLSNGTDLLYFNQNSPSSKRYFVMKDFNFDDSRTYFNLIEDLTSEQKEFLEESCKVSFCNNLYQSPSLTKIYDDEFTANDGVFLYKVKSKINSYLSSSYNYLYLIKDVTQPLVNSYSPMNNTRYYYRVQDDIIDSFKNKYLRLTIFDEHSGVEEITYSYRLNDDEYSDFYDVSYVSSPEGNFRIRTFEIPLSMVSSFGRYDFKLNITDIAGNSLNYDLSYFVEQDQFSRKPFVDLHTDFYAFDLTEEDLFEPVVQEMSSRRNVVWISKEPLTSSNPLEEYSYGYPVYFFDGSDNEGNNLYTYFDLIDIVAEDGTEIDYTFENVEEVLPGSVYYIGNLTYLKLDKSYFNENGVLNLNITFKIAADQNRTYVYTLYNYDFLVKELFPKEVITNKKTFSFDLDLDYFGTISSDSRLNELFIDLLPVGFENNLFWNYDFFDVNFFPYAINLNFIEDASWQNKRFNYNFEVIDIFENEFYFDFNISTDTKKPNFDLVTNLRELDGSFPSTLTFLVSEDSENVEYYSGLKEFTCTDSQDNKLTYNSFLNLVQDEISISGFSQGKWTCILYDNAGNFEQRAYNFVIDNVAPLIDLKVKKENKLLNTDVSGNYFINSPVNLKITITDSVPSSYVESLSVKLDEQEIFSSEAISSGEVYNAPEIELTTEILGDFGEKLLYIETKDRYGNSRTKEVLINYDSFGPVITSIESVYSNNDDLYHLPSSLDEFLENRFLSVNKKNITLVFKTSKKLNLANSLFSILSSSDDFTLSNVKEVSLEDKTYSINLVYDSDTDKYNNQFKLLLSDLYANSNEFKFNVSFYLEGPQIKSISPLITSLFEPTISVEMFYPVKECVVQYNDFFNGDNQLPSMVSNQDKTIFTTTITPFLSQDNIDENFLKTRREVDINVVCEDYSGVTTSEDRTIEFFIDENTIDFNVLNGDLFKQGYYYYEFNVDDQIIDLELNLGNEAICKYRFNNFIDDSKDFFDKEEEKYMNDDFEDKINFQLDLTEVSGFDAMYVVCKDISSLYSKPYMVKFNFLDVVYKIETERYYIDNVEDWKRNLYDSDIINMKTDSISNPKVKVLFPKSYSGLKCSFRNSNPENLLDAGEYYKFEKTLNEGENRFICTKDSTQILNKNFVLEKVEYNAPEVKFKDGNLNNGYIVVEINSTGNIEAQIIRNNQVIGDFINLSAGQYEFEVALIEGNNYITVKYKNGNKEAFSSTNWRSDAYYYTTPANIGINYFVPRLSVLRSFKQNDGHKLYFEVTNLDNLNLEKSRYTLYKLNNGDWELQHSLNNLLSLCDNDNINGLYCPMDLSASSFDGYYKIVVQLYDKLDNLGRREVSYIRMKQDVPEFYILDGSNFNYLNYRKDVVSNIKVISKKPLQELSANTYFVNKRAYMTSLNFAEKDLVYWDYDEDPENDPYRYTYVFNKPIIEYNSEYPYNLMKFYSQFIANEVDGEYAKSYEYVSYIIKDPSELVGAELGSGDDVIISIISNYFKNK